MYTITKNIASIVFARFGKLSVINKQNMPKTGGFVLVCTHIGWVDIIWLGLAVLPRVIHYMAKKELFQNPVIGWFLKSLHAFPVNRSNPGTSAIKLPAHYLEKGEIVTIFPTGTRTSERAQLKRGAIAIAQIANVPIVPAVYIGPKSIAIKDLFARKKITVVFGEPIVLDKAIEDAVEKKAYHLKIGNELDEVFKRLEESVKT